ncbi:MAG: murein biosynthesis integral membrane protein MurJ [Candidatus Eisenbacteria bacterium]|nr:murein biosynthesis integral membrane protein MurJ [Candidatus Eisenbacteria bacterium]
MRRNVEPTGAGRKRGIVRGFADIGLGTLVSRVSGFAREVVTAAVFGAGTSMDIFVAAFTIPNLVCRVLGETAVESAFMPLFRGLASKGERHAAWRLAAHTLNALTIVLIALVVLGIAASPLLVRLVATGFEGEVFEETVRMTRLMFPFGLVIGLAALMGAILLAHRRYRPYSLAPVMLNVGIIGSVALLSGELSFYSLGVGVLIGGSLQFLVQTPFARRLARRDGERLFRPGAGLRDENMRHVRRLAGPVLASAVIQRLGTLVDRLIASFLVPGSISSLYYSFRIVHLPYAILALSAGRSVAPLLSEQFALKDEESFRDTLVAGLRMNLAYLTPVIVLAVWHAETIVGLIYQRGAFDATDLAMTSSAFALYAVGLVSMGAEFLLVRAFAARLDTATPVKVAAGAFGLNVVLNLLLVRTPLRHAGLALATSLAMTAHASVLYTLMNRRLAATGARIAVSSLLRPLVKIAVGVLALVAVLWALDAFAGMAFARSVQLERALRLVIAGAAGGGVYLVVLRLLRVEEITELLGRLRR